MIINIFPLNIKKVLNFLIILFPVTFIIGNAAVNLNLFLISILGIILYKKQIFKIEKNIILISIIFFFIFVIASTLISQYENSNNSNLIRSIIYLRYLVFLLVLNCMINNDDFKFKYFLFSCLFFSSFVSLTVIYEATTGKPFLHYDTYTYHNPGIFRDELIAGGYIQRFGCLGLFFIPLVLKNDKKRNFVLLTLTLTFYFLSITLSGNRMPLILFVGFLLLSLIFLKKIKIPFFLGSIFGVLIFLSVINLDKDMKNYWSSFYTNVTTSLLPGSDLFILSELKKDHSDIKAKTDPKDRTPGLEEGRFDYGYWQDRNWKGFEVTTFGSGHRVIWTTALETWLDSPFIGNGIKSFRFTCKSKLDTPNRVCQNHTHNYYLEILNDTGLVGFILIILSTYILLLKQLVNNKLKKENQENSYLIFCSIFFVLLLEFFPFRSSGNFFSTYNSTFIFLLIGLFMSYGKKTKILF